MGIRDVGLRKFKIFGLDVAVRRPFFSRRKYQWLTIKNRPITVLAKDDVLRESDIPQRDPSIAHIAHSFRNSMLIFSIILIAALRNQSPYIPNGEAHEQSSYPLLHPPQPHGYRLHPRSTHRVRSTRTVSG